MVRIHQPLPFPHVPKTAFSGTRFRDMYPKTPFGVHVPAMRDIRKEKGRIISILHLYADRDVHACTGIFSFDWDENYGVTIEYPFFAIGEIVPCWV